MRAVAIFAFVAAYFGLPPCALAQPIGPDGPPEVVGPDQVEPKPVPTPRPTSKPKPKPKPEPSGDDDDGDDDDDDEGDDDDDDKPVDEANLGDHGESCQKRADCKSGFSCIQLACVDPSKPPPEPAGDDDDDDDGAAKAIFEGNSIFAGLSLAPGMSLLHNLQSGSTDLRAAFNFAIRGGLLLDDVELALWISPVTFATNLDKGGPSFQASATIGTYFNLTGDLYWPLRGGIGVVAANLPGLDALFQLRGDVVGLMYNYDAFLFELTAPSYRFNTDFDAGGLHSFLFGVTVTYVF